jgi:hypothetical protein
MLIIYIKVFHCFIYQAPIDQVQKKKKVLQSLTALDNKVLLQERWRILCYVVFDVLSYMLIYESIYLMETCITIYVHYTSRI